MKRKTLTTTEKHANFRSVTSMNIGRTILYTVYVYGVTCKHLSQKLIKAWFSWSKNVTQGKLWVVCNFSEK